MLMCFIVGQVLEVFNTFLMVKWATGDTDMIINLIGSVGNDSMSLAMYPAIMSKVQNAGLPSAAWGVINNKAKALDPSLMP